MAKRLKSVFTDDMGHCWLTETPNCEIHHIFYGSRRQQSEKFGYVIPLAKHLHTGDADSVHMNPNKGLDLMLKQMAQRHFEEHHGTRDDFREVFGKSYL